MNMLKDVIYYLAYVVMAVSAIVAVVSYFKYGIEKRKTAATLLLLQIDEIEDVLQAVKLLSAEDNLNGRTIMNIQNFECDAWTKNKHLLVKKLSETDKKVLTQYFARASSIKIACEKLITLQTNNWKEKAAALQAGIFWHLDGTTETISDEERKKIEYLRGKFSRIKQDFLPGVPKESLFVNIALMESLIGKCTYSKIKNLSYVKE